MKNFFRITYLFVITSWLFSCTPIDIFEKSVSIPGHDWQNDFRPSFSFEITDTVPRYNIFLVLRHTEKFNFNNIYINLYVKGPGQDTATKIQRDLRLATNKGWQGSGMDDIYEHRIPLATQTLKAGPYSFTVEQIMRENPLKEVLNVGLRLEKEALNAGSRTETDK